MKSKIVIALAAILAASPATAHGSSDPGHGHSSHDHAAVTYGEPGDPAKHSRDIVVVMKEADGRMLFEPASINVKLGEQIRFRLDNRGLLDHEFLLGTQAEIQEHADMMKAMPEMVHDDPNAKRVATNAKSDLIWRFTNAGEFDFACLIPGHREAGMTGKILVTQ